MILIFILFFFVCWLFLVTLTHTLRVTQMMGNPMQFLSFLQTEFDIDHIPQPNVDAVEPYVTREGFDPAIIATKSSAAGGLCDWVINIVKYHKINLEVAPLKAKLADAQDKLATAQASLQKAVDHVNALQAQLDTLLAEYEQARQEKLKCVFCCFFLFLFLFFSRLLTQFFFHFTGSRNKLARLLRAWTWPSVL